MNTLRHHTRRLSHALAADLARASEQLDADAARLRSTAESVAHGLTADLNRAGEQLDADAARLRTTVESVAHGLTADLNRAGEQLDADGDRFAAFVRVLLGHIDHAAARIDAVRPGLVSRGQAARLARTMTVTTLLLAIFASGAFATMLGARRGASVENIALDQAPGRQVALADAPAAPTGEGAHATGPVAATGGEGPAVAANPDAPIGPQTIPASRGALPIGKGMWIWQPERSENNDAAAIVKRAKATNLTHLYVRTGTLKGGFDGAEFLNRLLPLAHAAGIRVYGWDFPYLKDIDSDVARAAAAAKHLTPDGHRIDGFASDIELKSMGVNINNHTAFAYGQKLRAIVGREFPLIATVPRPSGALKFYPFPEVLAHFDAVAPMVYWMGNDPAATVIDTIQKLAPLGRPIIPVGQAYDGHGEGGPPGVPPRHQIIAFMQAAEKAGAIGVSWWSWQHADQEAWDAVRDADEFMPPIGPTMNPGQIRAYQALLHSLGFATTVTGEWDPASVKSVSDYQRAARLPVTGVVDAATRQTLLTPFPPPINPER